MRTSPGGFGPTLNTTISLTTIPTIRRVRTQEVSFERTTQQNIAFTNASSTKPIILNWFIVLVQTPCSLGFFEGTSSGSKKNCILGKLLGTFRSKTIPVFFWTPNIRERLPHPDSVFSGVGLLLSHEMTPHGKPHHTRSTQRFWCITWSRLGIIILFQLKNFLILELRYRAYI